MLIKKNNIMFCSIYSNCILKYDMCREWSGSVNSSLTFTLTLIKIFFEKNESKLILLVDPPCFTRYKRRRWLLDDHLPYTDLPITCFRTNAGRGPREFPCPIRVVPIWFDNTTNVRRVRMERDSVMSITFDRNGTFSHIFRW